MIILKIFLYIIGILYIIGTLSLLGKGYFFAWFLSLLFGLSFFPIVYEKIKGKIPNLKLKYYIICSFSLLIITTILISPSNSNKIQEKIEEKKEISDSKENLEKNETKMEKENNKVEIKNYKILTTNHQKTVENFSALIKEGLKKEEIIEIFKQIKSNECSKNCNIKLYSSDKINDLIYKYPLEKDEYLKVADVFVASLTFDTKNPENFFYYPFQDFKYKEYGGKNWKK